MSQHDVVFLSGVRTAIGGFGGSLQSKTPCELAAAVTAEAVKRAGVAQKSLVTVCLVMLFIPNAAICT